MKLTESQIKFMQEDMSVDLVCLIVERMGVSIKDAFSILYNSDLFSRLMDKRTGLYYKSPGHAYCYLEEELLSNSKC